MSNITLSQNAGFCFGVKRALDEAIATKENTVNNVFTLGQLIHNNDAVNFLRSKGIFPIEEDELSNLKEGDILVIRSHGTTPYVLDYLNSKKVKIVNATCPYVINIHKKVNMFYKQGYSIIIVGDKDHPEVMGINGWCENTAITTVDGNEILNFPSKVCVVSQTTEKLQTWERVLNILVHNCKEIIAFNTICDATSIRQKSAKELSSKVNMMVVIGGKQSSNTTKLYQICKENCTHTLFIENSGDLPGNIDYKNIKAIGVTAGASTPDWIIKEAINKMSEEKNIQENEQLTFMEQYDKQISVGEVVKGTVISVTEKGVFLNIGYKADGILPVEETINADEGSLSDNYKIGDELNVKIIRIRNEDGYVVLSAIELQRENAFKELRASFDNHEVITVLVKDVVKGGLIASFKGIRVFIPASHVELYHIEDLNDYKNKEMQITLIEFNESKRRTRIVGSRRDILKAEKDVKESQLWDVVKPEDVLVGEVKRLTDFGAFVDVGGIDGLLHVSQISYGHIGKPSDVLKVGDKINVIILEVDKENKKLSLSMKKLLDDPWKDVDVKYPVGNIVLGKVVRFANFGAFVELEPGVDALVHISEISHERIKTPGDELTIGQEIKAKILDVNKENKKIGLSIKAANEV